MASDAKLSEQVAALTSTVADLVRLVGMMNEEFEALPETRRARAARIEAERKAAHAARVQALITGSPDQIREILSDVSAARTLMQDVAFSENAAIAIVRRLAGDRELVNRFIGCWGQAHGGSVQRLIFEGEPAPEIVKVRGKAPPGQQMSTNSRILFYEGKGKSETEDFLYLSDETWMTARRWADLLANPRNDSLRAFATKGTIVAEPVSEQEARGWAWTERERGRHHEAAAKARPTVLSGEMGRGIDGKPSTGPSVAEAHARGVREAAAANARTAEAMSEAEPAWLKAKRAAQS